MVRFKQIPRIVIARQGIDQSPADALSRLGMSPGTPGVAKAGVCSRGGALHDEIRKRDLETAATCARPLQPLERSPRVTRGQREIRAKQQRKPHGSPLTGAVRPDRPEAGHGDRIKSAVHRLEIAALDEK